MTKESFSKVEKSDQKLYGPRTLIITGYGVKDQTNILEMISKLEIMNLPVKFIPETLAQSTLNEIASLPDLFGHGDPSALPRAVIMSGITENELHNIMNGYRMSGLPSQLWATLTPTSEAWPISFLLEELAAEKAAFEKRSQNSV